MYSHQLLRVNHDEWLRYAESRRLVKQAAAEAREAARPARRSRPRRALFGGLRSRRPFRYA
jgi:hypothetical protein